MGLSGHARDYTFDFSVLVIVAWFIDRLCILSVTRKIQLDDWEKH